MPDLSTYLFFSGNCGEAMRFYQKTFGGKLDMMTMGQSPMASEMPPGSADKIMHARLAFDGGVIMASDDVRAGGQSKGMNGFSVSVVYPTAGEAKQVFEALAKGGKITTPIDKSFWAEAFGMLVDRFGTPWMINGKMTMS